MSVRNPNDPYSAAQPDPFANFNPFAGEKVPTEPVPEPALPEVSVADETAIENDEAAELFTSDRDLYPEADAPQLGTSAGSPVGDIGGAGLGDTSLVAPTSIARFGVVRPSEPVNPQESKPTLGVDDEFEAQGPLSEEEIAAVPGAEDAPLSDITSDAIIDRRAKKLRDLEAVADVERTRVNMQRSREEAAYVAEQDAYARKLQELDEERAAAAREPIDPDKYFKDRGTGGTIRDVIGAAIGGYLAYGSKGNGVNTYVKHMSERIKRNIAAQMQNKRDTLADLDSQRGSTLQQMQLNAQERRRAYVLEDRALQEVEAELAREGAKYAEGGTSLESVELMKRALAGERAALARKNELEMRKEARAEGEFQLKVIDSKRKAMELDMKRAAQRPRGGSRRKGPGGTFKFGGFNVPNDTVVLGDEKGHLVQGFRAKDGTKYAIAFKTAGEAEYARQRMASVRNARRLRAAIARLGEHERLIARGELRGADAAKKKQELTAAIIHAAKQMGGTITDNDIKAMGKIIPEDADKIFQDKGGVDSRLENYVIMVEDQLMHATATYTAGGTGELNAARLSTGKMPVKRPKDESFQILHKGEYYDPDTGGTRALNPQEVDAHVRDVMNGVADGSHDANVVYKRFQELESEAAARGDDASAESYRRGYTSIFNTGRLKGPTGDAVSRKAKGIAAPWEDTPNEQRKRKLREAQDLKQSLVRPRSYGDIDGAIRRSMLEEQ